MAPFCGGARPGKPMGYQRVKSQPLRIGGGALNGRRLRSVPGISVRPTSGRVRQALFNMLRPVIRDAIFVDLFAGTGSVGLEALSHGAKQVYFVEQVPCGPLPTPQCRGLHRAISHRWRRHCGAVGTVAFMDTFYSSPYTPRRRANKSSRGIRGPNGWSFNNMQHACRSRFTAARQPRRYGDSSVIF